jgi:hypothetical protein
MGGAVGNRGEEVAGREGEAAARETSEWNDGECARETGRGVCV